MNYQQLIPIGIAIVFIGIITIMLGFALTALGQTDTKSDTKFSFFGLIGFIPFGFSNDKRLFFITATIALVFVLVALFLFFRNLSIK